MGRRHVNRNLLAVLVTVGVLALLAALSVESYTHRPQPTPTPTTCTRPLPDPDDCVQLGWLDGQWRCIPTEQAG